MRVLFAGGGTGGHLYPAIALADALRDRGARCEFVGTADRLEARIVPAAGYRLHAIASRPLTRKMSMETAQTVVTNAAGVAQAAGVLRSLRPDIAIATGGYVCFPAMVAARTLRLARLGRAALALLEPNARPGLTNRLLTPVVDEVWGAFDAPSAAARRYVRTGVPVRTSVLRRPNRIEAARRLGLDPGRRTIVVVGGSQGARSLNEAVAALVTRRALPAAWQVLHISGTRDFDYMQAEERRPFGDNRVVLLPYLDDLGDVYAVADVAICRSGASTLAELAAVALPSILIPYPHAAENHQAANALAFAAGGGALVLEDARVNADALWWMFRTLLEGDRLATMRASLRAAALGDPVATILARIDALVERRTHAT